MDEIKQRNSLHQKLVKILTEVRTRTTPWDLEDVEYQLERGHTYMKQCETVQEELLRLTKDDDGIKTHEKAFEPIETTFRELVPALRRLIKKLTPPPPSSRTSISTPPSSSTGSCGLNVKLPAIELPTFDGNYANWPSFKDLFLATVDANGKLAPAQKLQYLKTSLQNEPANLIKSLTIIDGHYKEAWDILKKRYDNEREIVYSIIYKLLYSKSVMTESPCELQNLIDNSNECLRSLKVLKQPVEHWDSVLIVMHLAKLDPQTKREWAIRQSGTNLPTFEEFTTFLENHIRGLLATRASSTMDKKKGDKHIKTHHTSTEGTCVICKGNHMYFKCNDFTSKSPTERSSIARRLHLCFNCLNPDHQLKNCRSKSTCKKCGRKHHTMLHADQSTAQPPKDTTSVPPKGAQDSNQNSSMSSLHTCVDTQVLLSTAVVRVMDCNGGSQLCRIFIDSGSQGTFITEDCVTRLGLKRKHSKITITGIASSSAGTTKGKVNVTLCNISNSINVNISAHILSQVTGMLPRFRCQIQDWAHLQGIELADPTYYEPGQVDILVGADYIGQIMQDGIRCGPPNSPTAQRTIFGWVLSGRVPIADPSTINIFPTTEGLEDTLRKFWEVEEPPKVRILTKEEKLVEEHFKNTYRRDENGRFIVSVPFNERKGELGASRDIAVRRLLQVERRLKKNPSLQQQYIEFMKEYEALGHMEQVPPSEEEEKVGVTNYLPHHFVLNENSSTTKLRVVFDGSTATSTGVSFNDVQMLGATLHDDLYDVLLRSRMINILLKGDIAKMYRNFFLTPQDADFHRILWRESPDDRIKVYRLLTVTYGTKYASHLSNRCIKQLSKDCEKKYPAASRSLDKETYVDDVITGGSNSQATISLYDQLSKAVNSACMELRKFSTSDPEVLAAIPENKREMTPHSFDNNETIKTLGVQWNPASDSFVFKYTQVTTCNVLTKRILLSDLARVYDPLGFLSAVTIRAKLLMQELWKLGLNWDEAVPEAIQQEWNKYQADLVSISQLSIPRKIIHDNVSRYELHGFSDASERAYGIVVYLRAIHNDGSVSVRFVTSKTRVAPVRQVTLPRLELQGAVMLAETINHVKEVIELVCEIFCYCDSTITLTWIAALPRRWRTYVANRVARIQELTPVDTWRHVAGMDNPADLASRGTTVEELTSRFWQQGPVWLSEPILPTLATPSDPGNAALEERSTEVMVHHVPIDVSNLERFSCLNRLKRVTARVLRFTHNAKKPADQRHSGPLKFQISCLQKQKPLLSSSKLLQLTPYLDLFGVLRVGGRLQNADIPESRKHQVILPSDNHLTYLIVQHFHLLHMHSGFQLTWSAIQAEYWILRGRDKVRHIIRSCVTCRRYRAEAAEQLMGNLPPSRVTPSRPFLHTGVDYAGPFTLKNPVGRIPKTYKGYICLFVCMATKAIHLEAVSALSTEAFIATLRRFVSRRGMVAHLYSDCGTNFQGADKELTKLVTSSEHNNSIAEQVVSQGITWHFNPPSAPHFGGIWESGVKSAKHHLRRVMGNSILTFEQFQTVLCQIEAVLNSRPLYPLSTDPTDLNVLTPGHFLIGEPLTSVPDEDLTAVTSNRLTQFQQQQQRVQHFWRRWSQEYLSTLQQRHKWFWEKEDVKVGTMVLIKEDTSPGSWLLGRVTKVHPGEDELPRRATVKTAASELLRPSWP